MNLPLGGILILLWLCSLAASSGPATKPQALQEANQQQQQLERHIQLEAQAGNHSLGTPLPPPMGNEGRGSLRKRRKLLKQLYPLLVAMLVGKAVLLPLLLKMLTALSTSSFVMSKVALATSGLLLLKWIFGGAGEPQRRRTHLEIVHVPALRESPPPSWHSWSDLAIGSSTQIDTKTHQKYIPVGSMEAPTFPGQPFL